MNIDILRNGKKKKGTNSSHGNEFELDALLLMYLKCVNLYNKGENGKELSFFVNSGVEAACKFDDIVIGLEYKSNTKLRNKYILVQCKHAETNRNKTDPIVIFTRYLGSKHIKEYFKSFDTISKQTSEHCEFIFLSNIAPPTKCFQNKAENQNICEIEKDLLPIGKEYFIMDECNCDHDNCGANIKTNTSSWKNFSNKFRLFLNEEDQLKDQILKNLENLYKDIKISDFESLYSTLFEETKQLHQPGFLWTQDTMLLDKVTAFRHLKKQSDELVHKYHGKIQISSNLNFDEINTDPISFTTRLNKLLLFKTLCALKSGYLFMFLREEADINRWKLARETLTYRNSTKIYIFLHGGLELPDDVGILEKEAAFYLRDDDDTEISDWSLELINDLKTAINSTTIRFQGKELQLKTVDCDWFKFLNDEEKCDILESKPLEVASEITPEMNGYIPRKCRKKILSEGLKIVIQKKIPRRTLEKFLLYVKTDNGNDTIIDEHDETFKNIEVARRYFQNSKIDEKWSYYLCSYFNGSLRLECSFGKQVQKDYSSTILTEEYLFSAEKITILTGVPGAGKSETMKNLAWKYKEAYKYHCVYFLNLGNFVETIEKASDEDLKSLKNFIALKLLRLETIELALFTNAWNKTGEAAIFFDSYDDLSNTARKRFCNILVPLERTKIAKIFISSRGSCVKDIEKSILQNSIELETLKIGEIHNYVQGLLNRNVTISDNTLDEQMQREIESRIYDHIRSDEKNNFLASPLHIKLITGALCYMKNYKVLTTSSLPLNLFRLYENYMNFRVSHFYTEKLKAINWGKLNEEKSQRLIREKLRGVPKFVCSFFFKDLYEPKTKKDMSDTKKALRDDLGLITNESGNTFEFAHKTFAEYFAADLIIKLFNENYNDAKTKLKILLTEEKYMFLRKFINCELPPPQDSAYTLREM